MLSNNSTAKVAIIDYGLGNLYSVRHACLTVGLDCVITNRHDDITRAAALILPGVGAFGDAMDSLRQLGLDELIVEFATAGKPILGICLGMQLLMTESHEFGRHKGLNLIEGDVVPFKSTKRGPDKYYKVPQVGWNQIALPKGVSNEDWDASLLQGVYPNSFMYFVHSYYVRPTKNHATRALTIYGETEYCSALRAGNIYAFQFHPERSGRNGLTIYSNFAHLLQPEKLKTTLRSTSEFI